MSLLFRGVIVGIAIASISASTQATACPINPVSQEQEVSLEDRLINGLKARTKEERLFIKQLVVLVNNGNVPQDLVDGTFFWVRDNKPFAKNKFIYFEKILRMRANEKKIGIPPFTQTVPPPIN